VNNTIELAQNMLDEFDTDHDEKLNVDEFIVAVRKADDTNNNILSEETEYKQWYIQHPTDEENNDDLSISSEVPTDNVTSKINSNINDDVIKTLSNGISRKIYLEFLSKFLFYFFLVLGRIFKRVGADVENKQLDSNKSMLTMKITNEFVHNNIQISSVDLQLFVDLYLARKQNSGLSY
jgi:hypothetical protein